MSIRGLLFSIIVMGACSQASAFWFQSSLSEIHQEIQLKYPNVEHVSITEFQENNRETVVFDVREANEYAVSRLDSAIHLSPKTNPKEFIELHGDAVRGKRVIFYCSVGRRSSAMAHKLAGTLEQLSASSSANLEGGLFHWVNQGQAVDGVGVHPYNRYWGRLVKDKSKIVYSVPYGNLKNP